MFRPNRRSAFGRHLGIGALIAVSLAARPAGAISSCTGDCDNDRQVAVEELLRCVAISLENPSAAPCAACDPSVDALVSIDELVRAVKIALGVHVQISGKCIFVTDGQMMPCPPNGSIEINRCNDPERCVTDDGVDPNAITPIIIGCPGTGECQDEEGNYSFETGDCRAVDAPMISSTTVVADGSATTLRSVAFTSEAVAQVVSNLSPFTEAAVRVIVDVGFADYDPRGYAPLILAVEQSETVQMLDLGTVEVMELPVRVADAAAEETVVLGVITDFGPARLPR
jgi:hypothetical protein